MYVNFAYPTMSISPIQLSHYLKIAETSVLLKVCNGVLIRSLKKFIFRYQYLVEIYSVSAEKITSPNMVLL